MPDVRPDVRITGWGEMPVAVEVIAAHAPDSASIHWYDAHDIPRIELYLPRTADLNQWATVTMSSLADVRVRWVCPTRWAQRWRRYQARVENILIQAEENTAVLGRRIQALGNTSKPTRDAWQTLYAICRATQEAHQQAQRHRNKPLWEALVATDPERGHWTQQADNMVRTITDVTRRGSAVAIQWTAQAFEQIHAAQEGALTRQSASRGIRDTLTIQNQWMTLMTWVHKFLDLAPTGQPSPLLHLRERIRQQHEIVKQSELRYRWILDRPNRLRSQVRGIRKIIAEAHVLLQEPPSEDKWQRHRQRDAVDQVRRSLATAEQRWYEEIQTLVAPERNRWDSQWSSLKLDRLNTELEQQRQLLEELMPNSVPQSAHEEDPRRPYYPAKSRQASGRDESNWGEVDSARQRAEQERQVEYARSIRAAFTTPPPDCVPRHTWFTWVQAMAVLYGHRKSSLPNDWETTRAQLLVANPIARWIGEAGVQYDVTAEDEANAEHLTTCRKRDFENLVYNDYAQLVDYEYGSYALRALWPRLIATMRANRDGWQSTGAPLHIEAGLRLATEIIGRRLSCEEQCSYVERQLIYRMKTLKWPTHGAWQGIQLGWHQLWEPTP